MISVRAVDLNEKIMRIKNLLAKLRVWAIDFEKPSDCFFVRVPCLDTI